MKYSIKTHIHTRGPLPEEVMPNDNRHDVNHPGAILRFWHTTGELLAEVTAARVLALLAEDGQVDRECYRIWTSAPAEYDYPYCIRTGRSRSQGGLSACMYEVLAFTCKSNAGGQMMRYQSGMYAASEPEEVTS